MSKHLMFLLIPMLVVVALFNNAASAEERTINVTGQYVAGAEESLNDAKQHAVEDAMRQAAEQAGIMIASYSKTRNLTLTDDEVTVVTAKIIRVTGKEFSVVPLADSRISVSVKVTAVICTDSLNEEVERVRQENARLRADNEHLQISKQRDQVFSEMSRMHDYIFRLYRPDTRARYKYWRKTVVMSSPQMFLNAFLKDMSNTRYANLNAATTKEEFDCAYGKIWLARAMHDQVVGAGEINHETKFDREMLTMMVFEGECLFMANAPGMALDIFNRVESIARSHQDITLEDDIYKDLTRYLDLLARWKQIIATS